MRPIESIIMPVPKLGAMLAQHLKRTLQRGRRHTKREGEGERGRTSEEYTDQSIAPALSKRTK